jgi:hypothetical protein
MVNMDGPMVTATAVPPSKRRRTARRRRVAISDTYRLLPAADVLSVLLRPSPPSR